MIKKLISHKYFIYHLRWQISALVMMGPMLFLQMFGFPLWLNLSIGQFIGAIIFYSIDKKIFAGKEADTVESEYETVINDIKAK